MASLVVLSCMTGTNCASLSCSKLFFNLQNIYNHLRIEDYASKFDLSRESIQSTVSATDCSFFRSLGALDLDQDSSLDSFCNEIQGSEIRVDNQDYFSSSRQCLQAHLYADLVNLYESCSQESYDYLSSDHDLGKEFD